MIISSKSKPVDLQALATAAEAAARQTPPLCRLPPLSRLFLSWGKPRRHSRRPERGLRVSVGSG